MIMYDKINTPEEDIANMCCWCLIRLCMLWPEDNAVATSCQGGNCLCLVWRGGHLPPQARLERSLKIVNVSWRIFIDQHHIALTPRSQCQSWQLITKSTNIQRWPLIDISDSLERPWRAGGTLVSEFQTKCFHKMQMFHSDLRYKGIGSIDHFYHNMFDFPYNFGRQEAEFEQE